MEKVLVFEGIEEGNVGIEGFEPSFGGPEAFVFGFEGYEVAGREVAGGFGEFKVCGETGLWDLEIEKEEGEGRKNDEKP